VRTRGLVITPFHVPPRILYIVVLLTLLLPMVVVTSPRVDAATRVHPMLLAIAAKDSNELVHVIVQKSTREKQPEQKVAELGGVVTSDLSIINAFVAHLPARQIRELASTDGIRWISLDAPVNDTSLLAAPRNTPTPTAGATSTPAATATPTLSPTPAGPSHGFISWANSVDIPSDSQIITNFNGTTIPAGRTIWLSAVVSVSGLGGSNPVTIRFHDGEIRFGSSGGVQHKLTVPDARMSFEPNANIGAETGYNTHTNLWSTTIRTGTVGPVFLTGMLYSAPFELRDIRDASWKGSFSSDTPGVQISWQWSAAVYTNFAPGLQGIDVKPCDGSSCSNYNNLNPAGTPERWKAYVTAGGTGNGGTNYAGTRTAAAAVSPQTTFKHVDRIIGSPHGPNGDFGSGSTLFTAFNGFTAQQKPDRVITRVEAVLRAYVPTRLRSTDDLLLQVAVGNNWGRSVRVENTVFDSYVGTSANAGTIYVDVTASLDTWQWSNFDADLKLKLNQSNFGSSSLVYYDAVGLRFTTAQGTDTSGGVAASAELAGPVDASRLSNVYNTTVRAPHVWNQAPLYPQGQGLSVAVVDSGLLQTKDLDKRVVANVSLNPDFQMAADKYGHGTHVSGIIAGNGGLSAGSYIGMAPKTNIVNVKVSNDIGLST
jgi:hypothetical protein